MPKFLLLLLSVEMSARYAFATEILPPVIPSSALAKNNIIRGRVITKVPRMTELTL